MKQSAKRYLTLFLSTFQLSAFTFGGGYVIVPLMRRRFVEGLRWIEEDEMIDLIAIAQSSPGPIAVNASIIVGYRVAGFAGALCSILGTVLPPLIILSLVSIIYAAFRDNVVVNLIMGCMQAGVAAVICDVVISMAQGIFKLRRTLPVLMMVLAFVAQTIFSIHLIIILLFCGVVGVGNYLYMKKDDA